MHLIVSVPEIIYLFSLLLVVFIFILLISLVRQLDFLNCCLKYKLSTNFSKKRRTNENKTMIRHNRRTNKAKLQERNHLRTSAENVYISMYFSE